MSKINKDNLICALIEAVKVQGEREKDSLLKSAYLTNISEVLQALQRGEDVEL